MFQVTNNGGVQRQSWDSKDKAVECSEVDLERSGDTRLAWVNPWQTWWRHRSWHAISVAQDALGLLCNPSSLRSMGMSDLLRV